MWNICWTDDACPDTHHVQRHDDHKVDADAGARRGKLPVLFHKMPVEGSKFLHGNETENHHSKHSCEDEGDLSRATGETISLGWRDGEERKL